MIKKIIFVFLLIQLMFFSSKRELYSINELEFITPSTEELDKCKFVLDAPSKVVFSISDV